MEEIVPTTPVSGSGSRETVQVLNVEILRVANEIESLLLPSNKNENGSAFGIVDKEGGPKWSRSVYFEPFIAIVNAYKDKASSTASTTPNKYAEPYKEEIYFHVTKSELKRQLEARQNNTQKSILGLYSSYKYDGKRRRAGNILNHFCSTDQRCRNILNLCVKGMMRRRNCRCYSHRSSLMDL
ncbi:hypothetical protein ACOSQ4_013143 [Xanthoceras sorbifolium]